ncbi:MAG: hypothetical protein JWM11_1355 [Planctomycetaceae bacterium]|nr:hypothetical protein [Planctomycetaceae bacterium]
MPATLEQRSGNQPYVDCDEYVDIQLSRTQSQIKATELLLSASALGLAVLAYVLTFVVLDQWIIPGGFSVFARAIWFGLLVAGGGSWLTSRILIPWFKTVHELYAAKMIESSDPTLKSSVLNLVDMQLNGISSRSPMVLQAMEKRAAVQLSRVNVDHAVDRKALMRLSYTLLAMLAACVLYVVCSPKDAFSSVQRLLLPVTQTAVATQTSLANITPEDTRMVAGEFLTVEVDVLGQVPSEVKLLFTTDDHEYVDQQVEMLRLEDGNPRFRGVVSGEKGRGLMQSLVYRIEAGDARTRDFKIDVVEPPSSQVEKISYVYPTYTKLEPKTQSGGSIEAWEGTKVSIAAVTSIPVTSAVLVMTETDDPKGRGEELRMSIRDGKFLSAGWTLNFRKDGTFARYYHIDCTTAVDESDPRPTVYTIKIQPDQRPDVSLIHPTQDLERPANVTVPLSVKASDPDFQLHFVTLRVEKGGEEIHAATLLDTERQTFEGTYDLDLEKLGKSGLRPGDEILYWIEARDNKKPHGNRTTTQRMKIKITDPVQAEEANKQLQQDRQQQKEELDRQDPERNKRDQGAEQQPQEDPNQPPRKPNNGPMRDDPEFKKAPANPKAPEPGEEAQPDPQQPNPQQGENPNKPEADQAPMPGDPPKAQPNAPQPGKNEPQNGDGQPGPQNQGAKAGTKPENSAGGNSKSEPQETDPKNTSKQNGANPSKNTGGSDPARKPSPADQQTALNKLLEKQEQEKSKSPPNPMDKKPEQQPEEQPDPMKSNESEKSEAGQAGSQQQKSKSQNDKNANKDQQPGTNGQSQSGANQESPEQPQNQPATDSKQPSNRDRTEKKQSAKKQPGGNSSEKSSADKKNTDQKNAEPMTAQNPDAANSDTEKPMPGQANRDNPKSKQPQGSQKTEANKVPMPGNKQGSGDEEPKPESVAEEGMKPESGENQPGASSKPGTNPKPSEKTAEQKSAAGQKGTERKTGAGQKDGEDSKTGLDQKSAEEQKSAAQNKVSRSKPNSAQPGDKKNTESNPAGPGQKQDQNQDPDAGTEGTQKSPQPEQKPGKVPMNQPMPGDAGADQQAKPNPEKEKDPAGADTGKPMPQPGEGDPMNESKEDPKGGAKNDRANPDANSPPGAPDKGMPPKPNKAGKDGGKPQQGKAGAEKAEKDAERGSGQKSNAGGQKLDAGEMPKDVEPGAADQTTPDKENASPTGNSKAGKKPMADVGGNPMPAEEGPNAERKAATGDEKGPATGADMPDDKAPRASSDVKKTPGSKDGVKTPSKQQVRDPNAAKSNTTKTKPDGTENQEEPQPGTGEKAEHPREKAPGADPSQNEPAPGKGKPNQKSQKPDSGENGGGTPQDQGTEGSKQEGKGDDTERPGEQSVAKPGQPGKPGKKQGSGAQKRPGDSKSGEEKTAPEQKPDGTEKQSPSDPMTAESPKPEASSDESESKAQETAKNGTEKKNSPGQKPKPAGGQQDAKNQKSTPEKSESGAGEPPAGQEPPEGSAKEEGGQPESQSGQPGKAGKSGSKPGKPGSQPGKSQAGQSSQGGGNSAGGPKDNGESGNDPGNGPGDANGKQPNQLPPDEQDQAAQEAEEKANEEYARKASSLVLKKLKKELDRGEVDPKMLEELGWTKDDMQRFVKQLEKQLQDSGDDNSAESEARRKQFEETLKAAGASLTGKTKKKTAKAGPTTRVDETGARRIPVPLEYQELYEEYNKDLAKPAEAGTKK